MATAPCFEPMVLLLQHTAWDGLIERSAVTDMIRRDYGGPEVKRAAVRADNIRSEIAQVVASGNKPTEEWLANLHESLTKVAFGEPYMQLSGGKIDNLACMDIEREAYHEASKIE